MFLVILLFGSAVSGHAFQAQNAAPQKSSTSRDDLLDINTATPVQLKALPGMGDAYARRVIDGRPYLAKNQLVTRGVLPEAEYARIRELIIAHHIAGR